jgi:hypothetical protein
MKNGGDMKIDKLTRIILAAIAIALWVIAINPWLHPVPVAAQQRDWETSVESLLKSVQKDVARIQTGTCANSKICGEKSK